MCAVQVFDKSVVVRTRNTKLSYYKDQLKLECQVNIVLVEPSCLVLLVPQWPLLNSYLVVHQYDKRLFVLLNKKLNLMLKQLHLKMFLIALNVTPLPEPENFVNVFKAERTGGIVSSKP